MVRNLMEEIVKQCLDEMMGAQESLKGCDVKTQDDIMAIALNSLPPKYVSSLQGEMFIKAQAQQMKPEVYRELSLAAEKVLNYSRKSEFQQPSE
ncbi:late competence development ComFB family protein [Paenibacillus athensensis]|uniref:Competence protein ComFB n=1 Tax=Paenibacillus athensensis TaxID=1967502 RepID=A0A4Y8PRN6_9BACL|nr:late competence development ComFB family protein [Paenibacillus athensensis]MCD1261519.1 late competence development ComFB family protein [Paenibacillus athensensis]